jgi:hypothetical protein
LLNIDACLSFQAGGGANAFIGGGGSDTVTFYMGVYVPRPALPAGPATIPRA